MTPVEHAQALKRAAEAATGEAKRATLEAAAEAYGVRGRMEKVATWPW